MNFLMPARLITGPGCVGASAALISAYGGRCLIVTGASGAKRSGALDDVTAALDAQGIAYQVFDKVRPNPTVTQCAEGGVAARELGADFILGVGGGSPLDAAKAVAVFAANPGLSEDGLYAGNWPAPPKPCVLVGTTAGTGSEVTPVSVLIDSKGRKHSLRSERIYAAIAFGDAKYTETLSRAVTLSTGVDALSHCIESYFSKKADEVSRAFAVRGARLLVPSLSAAAEVAPSPELRTRLYEASILGGMAINTTGTNMPHNVGYYLTERYGVPHGVACAVFQPALLSHMKRSVPETAAAFYRECGFDENALLAVLHKVTPALDVRMTEEEIRGQLPRWENNASVEGALGDITAAQIGETLREKFI